MLGLQKDVVWVAMMMIAVFHAAAEAAETDP
jgi:hypothetical protein